MDESRRIDATDAQAPATSLPGNAQCQGRPADTTAAYRELVHRYLYDDGNQALAEAVRLGHEAGTEGLGLARLTAIHRSVLAEFAAPGAELPEAPRIPCRPEFQALFDAVIEGYDEAITELHRRVAGLERANFHLTAAIGRKDRAISELRRSGEALHKTREELAKRAEAQTRELAVAGETLRAEILERKLTEIALGESEARFRSIFDKARIGIALLDTEGRIRESNLALQEMLGYSAAELHGRGMLEFSDPEDIGLSAGHFCDLVDGKCRYFNLEKRMIRKDGARLWVRKIVSGVYALGGGLQFAIDMIEDITEGKLAESALKESEARFRQIADMTREWIWEQDIDGRYIYSSAAVESILGFSADEILGQYYYDLYFPEDRQSFAAQAPGLIAKKETFLRLINRYRHQSGREIFTESTGTPILDAEGRLLKWRGVDHDITERKRFEDEVRLRDRAIEASRVGIVITDPHQPGNPIIYANSAFVEMVGRSRDEVIGQNAKFLQGTETDPAAVAKIREAIRDQHDCHLTLKNYRKDGTPFWNELFISPVRDNDGRLTHFIGTQTDVTALRRIEEERHEMQIARQIQLSLLPGAPLKADGALVAGYCLPAVHVGGDYFDYFDSENSLDVVIADVSGHSVGAALIMAEARSTLKMETHRMMQTQRGASQDANKTLADLNDLLFEDLNRADMFITMFYLRYLTATGEIVYANAGHNPPLLLRRDERQCAELDAEGLILGVRKHVDFEQKRLGFGPGDTLLLYTDGIIEARNKTGDLFGTTRLREIFATHAHADPDRLIAIILDELGRFAGSRSFEDDISLVVLKAD